MSKRLVRHSDTRRTRTYEYQPWTRPHNDFETQPGDRTCTVPDRHGRHTPPFPRTLLSPTWDKGPWDKEDSRNGEVRQRVGPLVGPPGEEGTGDETPPVGHGSHHRPRVTGSHNLLDSRPPSPYPNSVSWTQDLGEDGGWSVNSHWRTKWQRTRSNILNPLQWKSVFDLFGIYGMSFVVRKFFIKNKAVLKSQNVFNVLIMFLKRSEPMDLQL